MVGRPGQGGVDIPVVTSVDATAFELGQRAARMLLARIERPDTPGETVLVSPRLEVRGSSGPVPAGS